ncbi:MAG: hypothetical protein CTY28_11330 [Hyphomicrobium sp.]|nr:MAG: hypothetical protein CTY28_11330 [Hyphomicrobium sp.]
MIEAQAEPEPLVKLSDDPERPGCQKVDVSTFIAAVAHQYYSSDPAKKLSAMRNALSVMALDYHELTHWRVDPILTRLITDIVSMLEDMGEHAKHPLVKFASGPGRRGNRPSSAYLKDAKAALGAAVEVRHQYATKFLQEPDQKTVTAACAWVLQKAKARLSRSRLSIDDIFSSGEWRKTTAERSEQKGRSGDRTDRLEDFRRQQLSGGQWSYQLAWVRHNNDPDDHLAFLERLLDCVADRAFQAKP